MSTSDRDTKRRGVVGHGVHTAFYVSRGGARGSGAVAHLPTDSATASGARFGGRQQQRRHCKNTIAVVVGRQQR